MSPGRCRRCPGIRITVVLLRGVEEVDDRRLAGEAAIEPGHAAARGQRAITPADDRQEPEFRVSPRSKERSPVTGRIGQTRPPRLVSRFPSYDDRRKCPRDLPSAQAKPDPPQTAGQRTRGRDGLVAATDFRTSKALGRMIGGSHCGRAGSCWRYWPRRTPTRPGSAEPHRRSPASAVVASVRRPQRSYSLNRPVPGQQRPRMELPRPKDRR